MDNERTQPSASKSRSIEEYLKSREEAKKKQEASKK